MSKLIICEKSSQAQAVSSALGLNNRQDGYLTMMIFIVLGVLGIYLKE